MAKIIAFVLRYRAKFLPKFKLNRCVFPLCMHLLRLKNHLVRAIYSTHNHSFLPEFTRFLFELNKFGSCGMVISCCGAKFMRLREY